jgi:hypothetical protein
MFDWLKGLDSPPVLDASLSFESQVLKDAFAEWSRHTPLPSRADFTPRNAKSFLGNMVIFEQQDATFRIRLMGTRITTVLGEMQGKVLEEALPADVAARWKAVLIRTLETQTPVRVLKQVGFKDLHFLRAEILVAPLRDSENHPTMLLTVATFQFGISNNRKLDSLIEAK